MWNSTSRETEHGKKYELSELEALITYVALVIERDEDANDRSLEKDAECELHYVSFLKGITNGEYFYALYEIFAEMVSPEPSKDVAYKEAALASVLDGLSEEFLEQFPHREFDADTAREIWELHKACRRGQPVWTDEDGELLDPPALEKITVDQWEGILEQIKDEFLWDRDWELCKEGTFALFDEQPHWPTYQEFRTARVWLLKTCPTPRAAELSSTE